MVTPQWWWQAAVSDECDALVAAMKRIPTPSIRLHPQKSAAFRELSLEGVPWCPTGQYLEERPLFTLDPHFHAGAYYVQEASSMFLAQLADLFREQGIKRVLDLCAAPGGKTTLLAELLPQEGILVANEVIRSRLPALTENVAKWGYAQVVVTNNDAKDFERLPHYFDAMVADLPCSGEGMFRKDPQAINEWSPDNVRLCAERQRRIVADAWGALRPGGYLVYSTCTFNRMENEENVAWISSRLGATPCPLPIDPAWGVWEEQKGCYRFLPHRLKGEGFFFALLQKNEAQGSNLHRPLRVKKVAPLGRWQAPGAWVHRAYDLFAKGDLIKALPTEQAAEMMEIDALFRAIQSGVAVARNKGKDLIPEADLALSCLMNRDIFPAVEIDLITARRYLARETFVLEDAPLGYLLLCYQGSRLGFVKNIGSRVNNLYPQSRRIRMGIF